MSASSSHHLLLAPLLVMAVLAALLPHWSCATPLCKTSAKKDNCTFGTTKDYCRNIVCAKGPGDRCGGPSNLFGRCGEGMHCSCGVCSGCSVITLDCHVGRPGCRS